MTKPTTRSGRGEKRPQRPLTKEECELDQVTSCDTARPGCSGDRPGWLQHHRRGWQRRHLYREGRHWRGRGRQGRNQELGGHTARWFHPAPEVTVPAVRLGGVLVRVSPRIVAFGSPRERLAPGLRCSGGKSDVCVKTGHQHIRQSSLSGGAGRAHDVLVRTLVAGDLVGGA